MILGVNSLASRGLGQLGRLETVPLDAKADAYLVMGDPGAEANLDLGPVVHYLMGMERAIDGARLVFTSPLHKENYVRRYGVGQKGVCIPLPVDMERWLAIRDHANGRQGAMWYGTPHVDTGIDIAIEWAKRESIPLDIFGDGLGEQSPTDIVKLHPGLSDEQADLALTAHKAYVSFPRKPDYGTRLLEAWLAGLEIIYSGLLGFESYNKSWTDMAIWCNRSESELMEMVESL